MRKNAFDLLLNRARLRRGNAGQRSRVVWRKRTNHHSPLGSQDTMERRGLACACTYTLLFLCLTAVGVASPVDVEAASLWSEESAAIYAQQPRSFRAGELLTMIIVEEASASYNTGSEGDEASSVTVGPGAGLLNNLLPYLRGETATSYSGEGSTNRRGELTARLTVSIVEIEAGTGNLIIEGKQRIEVNQDVQELFVRGKIRPTDVAPDNTILSSYVAEAEIKLDGEGPNADSSKPGILTRFFSWLL